MQLLEERRGTEEDIKNRLWEWGANTLNPYFENESCFKKLIDDSHIREHRDRWFFGTSDDGDVKKLTEDYLIKNKLAGSFDLVTADGSTDTQVCWQKFWILLKFLKIEKKILDFWKKSRFHLFKSS